MPKGGNLARFLIKSPRRRNLNTLSKTGQNGPPWARFPPYVQIRFCHTILANKGKHNFIYKFFAIALGARFPPYDQIRLNEYIGQLYFILNTLYFLLELIRVI